MWRLGIIWLSLWGLIFAASSLFGVGVLVRTAATGHTLSDPQGGALVVLVLLSLVTFAVSSLVVGALDHIVSFNMWLAQRKEIKRNKNLSKEIDVLKLEKEKRKLMKELEIEG